MADSEMRQWTIVLVLTALFLSLVVLAQILTRYSTAYMVAPREITTFIDAVDFSIQENESYDRDVARVQRLEDKIRLGRLLREIQKGSDDLREELNSILIAEGGTTLKTSARIIWASKRPDLEERVRRLDLLRMRFLVVYMGIVATAATAADKQSPSSSPRDAEKAAAYQQTPVKPALMRALTESIQKKPPLRRLTTQAIGHPNTVGGDHRRGWAGVVQELQRSPRMHQRHASIEMAMSQTP
jgi:hypothetical protein